jgi:transaldolase / glucose-6-phosphate isomerase
MTRENPLIGIQKLGQSVWMDFIRRNMILSGELARMIEQDGLRGVTSNPSIFDHAIADSSDYDVAIRGLALAGRSVAEIYQTLTVEDVQRAADAFRSTWDGSQGRHGFVSLEVNPHLAHDADGTVEEARRLWAALDRPNVFIKVPATLEGLDAIRRLIAEGINVNVTLLFGLPRYREVAEAYLAGLEARHAAGEPIDRVASVASFFLSRIDVLVDPTLETLIEAGGRTAEVAGRCHGQVAIASARLAYQIYREVFSDERFRTLESAGARTQRVLWASTSTKNPAYSDVKYVEALIGPETINTLPVETLDAYRDHGRPEARLEHELDKATALLADLSELGIVLDRVTQQLENEGVEKFNRPFDSLMKTLAERREAALAETVDRDEPALGAAEDAVRTRLASLDGENFAARLWRRDASLWSKDPQQQEQIDNALGWLEVAETMLARLPELGELTSSVAEDGIERAVHMGMGGSSLAPMVFARCLAPSGRGLTVIVLDTTDPTTVRRIADGSPLAKSLFIVASKSGTTTEARCFGDTFLARLLEHLDGEAGRHMVAITDPGTPLDDHAAEQGFRATFRNFPDIGGRYSALSYFGLVPAALAGIDVGELLVRALRMVHACAGTVPASDSPGLRLGATLGELARRGRNKLTLVVPARLSTFGTWLEQLLAESTGKHGTGILPVAGEPLGTPTCYGDDRLFVRIRVAGEEEPEVETTLDALQRAGHPVVTLVLGDDLDLAQEMVRWEIATAAAGAILEINPFDQPNVQESKDNTRALLDSLDDDGKLPRERPAVSEGPLALAGSAAEGSVHASLTRFLAQARPGGYLALLAYLTETDATTRALEHLRLELRDALRVATTVGFGPRYLHSTGQLHKGGPEGGLYLVLTGDDGEDVAVPGRPYSFGVLREAQVRGDLEALGRHGRTALRVYLTGDPERALATLREQITAAVREVAE